MSTVTIRLKFRPDIEAGVKAAMLQEIGKGLGAAMALCSAYSMEEAEDAPAEPAEPAARRARGTGGIPTGYANHKSVKAIMKHYEVGTAFDRGHALGWIVDGGLKESTTNSALSILSRAGHIAKESNGGFQFLKPLPAANGAGA